MAILRWRPLGQSSWGQSVDRWEPFRELSDFQSEMNRLFDGMFARPMAMPGTERVWAPAVDMYETKDELVVTAELAGMSEKDIKLSLADDVLTLRGERFSSQDVKPEEAHRGERWYGKFERTLSLPIPVQADKVTAAYRDGVLTVKLPKVEEVKPKEIEIAVG
jgi:HSP20 family protein